MLRARLSSVTIIFILLFFNAIQASPGAKIQVALLLDTSNSMDGLIDQAKSQLWKVVNEFALAKQNGEMPELEIALYEYGNNALSRNKGFIRQVASLTTDLDLISDELFKLTTNGGSEYCGQVIQSAANGLSWSDDQNVLKIIFIAGNEPFSQGSVDYQKACRETISKGIIVNTIFCGNFGEGVRTHWKEGADLADGKYMNIDQNQAVVHIDAPQDAEINLLNKALNETYIPYGSKGESLKKRQLEQDSNAGAYGSANVSQRAVSKASMNYMNTSWDLVDAIDEGAVDLENVSVDDLPEEMRKMTPEERKSFVDAKRSERRKIQENIRQLNDERRKYVAAKQRESSESGTLDSAIIDAVREQAGQRDFKFE